MRYEYNDFIYKYGDKQPTSDKKGQQNKSVALYIFIYYHFPPAPAPPVEPPPKPPKPPPMDPPPKEEPPLDIGPV